MNEFQKIIKIFAVCLAIVIIVNIFGFIISGLSIITHIGNANIVEGKSFTETYKDVQKINLDTASANIEIKIGDEFKVEIDTKNKVTSRLNNGELKVEEKQRWFWNTKFSGNITIYVPENIILKDLDLNTGAGKITIDNIKSEKCNIEHGAGLLKMSNSNFDKTNIDGGAGKIEIYSSKLNDLHLDCGVGKVEIEAMITGNSKVSADVGQIDLLLLGNSEDYKIRVGKGIGSISINRDEYSSNYTYGSGNNKIEVEGGIGSIDIKFE